MIEKWLTGVITALLATILTGLLLIVLFIIAVTIWNMPRIWEHYT